jgi:ribosomal protein S3AE
MPPRPMRLGASRPRHPMRTSTSNTASRAAWADADTADRVVRRVMSVNGVRAVMTYMRTPDARPIERAEGDSALLARPRAAFQRDYIRQQIMRRWPAVNDDDILASNGHLERMAALVAMKTGRPESEIRPELDTILIQPVQKPVMSLASSATLNSPAPH